jgi:biotin carboxyl carrier protein
LAIQSVFEPVVEIETYNMTYEIHAPVTGILSVLVKDGASVEPGTVVEVIHQV